MNRLARSVAAVSVAISSIALAQPAVEREIGTSQTREDEVVLERLNDERQESAQATEVAATENDNAESAARPLSLEEYFDLIRAGQIENPSQCSLEAVELFDYIEENQSCQTDAECSADFVGVCPFGCYFALNTESADDVVSTLRRHERECLMCQYECIAHEYDAVCIANRCELQEPASAEP